ncbi:collagen alpha-1(I) chain-like, partial [Daubentonia madagascariensis]
MLMRAGGGGQGRPRGGSCAEGGTPGVGGGCPQSPIFAFKTSRGHWEPDRARRGREGAACAPGERLRPRGRGCPRPGLGAPAPTPRRGVRGSDQLSSALGSVPEDPAPPPRRRSVWGSSAPRAGGREVGAEADARHPRPAPA